MSPHNFARIAHILLPHDYLNYWLTGRYVAEYGDASGTGFFDVRKRAWAPAALSLIDGGSGHLAAALPELVAPDAVVGPLTEAAAKALGLSSACLVAAGGGDNMMGAIGTGNVREGVVTMSFGTSATVYAYSDVPVLDPTGAVAPFCSSTGGWLPLVCTMNAANVTSGAAHLLGRDVSFVSEALAATAARRRRHDGAAVPQRRADARPADSARLHSRPVGGQHDGGEFDAGDGRGRDLRRARRSRAAFSARGRPSASS